MESYGAYDFESGEARDSESGPKTFAFSDAMNNFDFGQMRNGAWEDEEYGPDEYASNGRH